MTKDDLKDLIDTLQFIHDTDGHEKDGNPLSSIIFDDEEGLLLRYKVPAKVAPVKLNVTLRDGNGNTVAKVSAPHNLPIEMPGSEEVH